MLQWSQLEALAMTQKEWMRRYRELSLLAQRNGNYAAAVRAEDRISRIAGLFRPRRPQECSPLSELTARERGELRVLVEAAIERTRRRDTDPQPPLSGRERHALR